MCLATMAYVYAQLHSMCYYFSTHGKFHPVSNFTELHALILAARSYADIHKWPPCTIDPFLVSMTLCHIGGKVLANHGGQYWSVDLVT